MKTTMKEFINNNKIIAYHGTNNIFEIFDDDKPIFFSNNINTAKNIWK
jgi:hypothetical protein